ncbi:hypothetical protein LINPERPRIM_LOCUS12632 [Linum perenne]
MWLLLMFLGKPTSCADYLANLGHRFHFGLHLFSQPDPALAYWLRFDLLGSPRQESFLFKF